MSSDLKDLLKNCLETVKDYDSDITELQKEFDEEVKKSAERSKNLEFQIQYPAIPLTDEEVLEILGKKICVLL